MYELKYDGVRAIVAVDGSEVRVVGRRGRDETGRYPEAAAIRPASTRTAVLDCEIVALDEAGHPDFERLQSRINVGGAGDAARAAARHPVTFVAFDLLSLDGRDLTATELRIRKKRSGMVGPPAGALRRPRRGGRRELLRRGLRAGPGGMVAKRADSSTSGTAPPDWIKVKAWHTQTCAIAG